MNNNTTNIKKHTSPNSLLGFFCACLFISGPMVILIGIEMQSILGIFVCLFGFAMLYFSMTFIDTSGEDA